MIKIFKRNDFKPNTRYFKISVYAFAVIALSIILYKVLSNPSNIFKVFDNFKNYFFQVMSPFVYGFFIAYLINPFVRLIENKLFLKTNFLANRAKLSRGLAILLALSSVIGLIIWIIIFFAPGTTKSIATFINNLPTNLKILREQGLKLLAQTDYIDMDQVYIILDKTYQRFIDLSNDIPLIMQTVLGSTYLAASTLIKIVMGIFISFYMLYEKETFAINFKKAVYALASDKKADRFFYNSKRVNTIFEKFIVGKALDSLIIGILCFVVTTLFKLPYAGIISFIVGVTNMIPYFGPFIGGIPAVLIVLIVTPNKAFLMFLIILAIQQFDGNFLGPKILGASIGISPLWIILAIVVGGAVAGPLGMFLGVPILGSLRIFINEYIDRKYKEKYASMPIGTDACNTSSTDKK